MLKKHLVAFTLLALVQACGKEEQPRHQTDSVANDADAVADQAVDTGDTGDSDAVVPSDAPATVEASVPVAEETPAPVAEEAPPPVVEQPAPAETIDTSSYSQGSGGGTGLVEQAFTASNGLKSKYKINAPADAGLAKVYGLHIHLHGDGGGGYKDFPNKELKNGLIGVTVKAPNALQAWGRAAGKQHGVFLQELIQEELLKKYNIDTKRIYFSGVSGGAYFLSGTFIPTYGNVYRSGAFLMCGGEEPRVDFAMPDFLKNFRIHFQVTAGERLDIRRSVTKTLVAYGQALDDAGADEALLSSEFKGDGGHCEFDGKGYTTGIQYMMDLKFSSILPK